MTRLALFLSAVFWSFGLLAAEDETSQPDLEQAMHDAAGVALVNVTSLKEIDARPGDGPLYVQVEMEIIESSGKTMPTLSIVKEPGGMRPSPSMVERPLVVSPLKPDSLTPGEEYWILFSSRLDEKYVQGVVAFWVADDADVSNALAEAVRKDRYLWQPQISRQTGLTVGHLLEPEQNRWRLRVSQANKVLWEKVLEGLPPDGSWRLWLDTFVHVGGRGGEAKIPNDTPVLLVATNRTFEADKECGIDAGLYSVYYVFDALAGRLVAESVYEGSAERCQRSYDMASGRMIVLDLFTLQTGGISIGADEDTWLRRESRRYDKNTGKLAETLYYRFGQTEVNGLPAGTGWLPIDAPKQ